MGIILKICNTLDISIYDVVNLEPILYNPFFEENLPEFLKEDIEFLKKNNPLYDCYLDETNSSINVCEIENLISKEQADYLRKKYLRL